MTELLTTKLFIAILLAIGYCFIFWKLTDLNRYRKPLFIYSISIQALFLIFFTSFTLFLKENQANRGLEYFGLGLVIFYITIVSPLIVSLFVSIYKKMKKTNQLKGLGILVFLFLILLAIGITFVGYYIYILFYYGFAP